MDLLKRYWPRMLFAMMASLFLFAAAHVAQQNLPGTLLAVSLYKAHLLTLGGWAGYWLDRGLFPYARPHEPLDALEDDKLHGSPARAMGDGVEMVLGSLVPIANDMMIRRAIVVAACVLAAALAA